MAKASIKEQYDKLEPQKRRITAIFEVQENRISFQLTDNLIDQKHCFLYPESLDLYPELLGPERFYENLSLNSYSRIYSPTSLEQLKRRIDLFESQKFLQKTSLIIGAHSDPFSPFERFELTIKLLKQLEERKFAEIILQTRSPLILLGLPSLKKLSANCNHNLTVRFALETIDPEQAHRYLPTTPPVAERLQAIKALQKLGINTEIVVAPLLPYGEWREDAEKTATTLTQHARVSAVLALYDGIDKEVRKERWFETITDALAKRREFFWLRADSSQPLLNALKANQ
ncbi:MAG TPA: radical SAM protein [Oligoflexia bacterium]|nr:radical SAM protein [Oligoflexia bacterium]HMP27916.1 radical SAM protein [Oligoflexia bacterium]